MKIHGNTGRKRPDVSLRQKGENNVAKRPEVRRKISDHCKGRFVPSERGNFKKGNQFWKLRDHKKLKEKLIINNQCKEFREKISNTAKKNWKNPEYRNKMIKSFSKRITSKKRNGSHRKGLTMEQEYGIKKANQIKRKNKKSHKGITYSKETNKKKGRSGKLNVMSRPEIKLKQLIACRTYGKQWKDGISFEPYTKEFDIKFKRAIRKRDNYICLKCGKHQEKENRSLSIHHINYNKKLSIPQNCCTLCRSCNAIVNSNREYWEQYFKKLIKEKYNNASIDMLC